MKKDLVDTTLERTNETLPVYQELQTEMEKYEVLKIRQLHEGNLL
jgi:hypothetical protein